MNFEEYAKVAKAVADPKRVKILELLSCGSLCACDILEHFDFTQPTLSHHIRVLSEAGLVASEKTGTWHHYTIDQEKAQKYIDETVHLLTHSEECSCQSSSVCRPDETMSTTI